MYLANRTLIEEHLLRFKWSEALRLKGSSGAALAMIHRDAAAALANGRTSAFVHQQLR
jgi:hypothetical protein